MEQTFEAILVRQCAPTLAGMKPGSLFCAKAESLCAVRQKAALWDERLRPFGLSVKILLERPGAGSAVVYVYRKSHLAQVLFSEDCREFLRKAGYAAAEPERMLGQLSRRLKTQGEFPHEIGVFLGYPLRDVVGFIENRGRNFTCCGFWKSYSDPKAIQKCFDCYRRCIDDYVRMYEGGTTIEELAVPA